MLRILRVTCLGVAISLAIAMLTTAVQAGTIIKLSLGSDSAPDIEYSGGVAGVLKTASDGVAATTGDQNTPVEYSDFLDAPFADILTPTASFTMNNLVASGPASTFGPLVIQNFTGGFLRLYDPANVLLLEGTLANSALTGPIGPPATGALFTTTFAAITDGTLRPRLLPGSLTLSMSLTDINNGTGFTVVAGAAPVLNAFQADVTMNIAARQIPEPTAAVLLTAGTALAGVVLGRRARRRV